MEILIGIGLESIRLGSLPKEIPGLEEYELEVIPQYSSEYDGRRELSKDHIGYLFKDGEGLVCLSFNETSFTKYELSLLGKKLAGLEVFDVKSFLSLNGIDFIENVDPYGEGEVDDIECLKSGLIFYFVESKLESLEVFKPKNT